MQILTVKNLSFSFFLLSKLLWASAPTPTPIDDQYFVILSTPAMKTKDSNYQSIKRSMVAIQEFIVADGGVVLDHFLHAFVGFHARLRPGQVEILEQREDVSLLVKNGPVFLWEEQTSQLPWCDVLYFFDLGTPLGHI